MSSIGQGSSNINCTSCVSFEGKTGEKAEHQSTFDANFTVGGPNGKQDLYVRKQDNENTVHAQQHVPA